MVICNPKSQSSCQLLCILGVHSLWQISYSVHPNSSRQNVKIKTANSWHFENYNESMMFTDDTNEISDLSRLLLRKLFNFINVGRKGNMLQ